MSFWTDSLKEWLIRFICESTVVTLTVFCFWISQQRQAIERCYLCFTQPFCVITFSELKYNFLCSGTEYCGSVYLTLKKSKMELCLNLFCCFFPRHSNRDRWLIFSSWAGLIMGSRPPHCLWLTSWVPWSTSSSGRSRLSAHSGGVIRSARPWWSTAALASAGPVSN